MATKLISIIITCYNQAATIGKALSSAMQQKSPVPYEIIVMDDDSADDSAQVIADVVDGRKNVQRIRNSENLGLIGTINKAMEYVNGDYFVRLDGDDRFLPGILESLWTTKLKNKADIVIGDYVKWHVETNTRDTIHGARAISDYIMCGNLIPTEVVRRVGSFRDLLFEEYDLFLRLKRDNLVWAYSNLALYEYTQHDASICHREDYWKRGMEQLLKLWDRQVLLENGFENMLGKYGL